MFLSDFFVFKNVCFQGWREIEMTWRKGNVSYSFQADLACLGAFSFASPSV
jgi:hypothetical protein